MITVYRKLCIINAFSATTLCCCSHPPQIVTWQRKRVAVLSVAGGISCTEEFIIYFLVAG